MTRLDLRARGLRTPMHTGLIRMDKQALYPWMAAPIRPMETLIGCRVSCDAFFNQMVKIGTHIPIGFEVAAWILPMSALGAEFQDLVVSDAEDSIAESIGSLRDAGQNVPTPGAESSQGHLSGTALGTRQRLWAGEIGTAAVAGQPAPDDSYYARYVSAATYAVARAHYDMEPEDTDPQSTAAGGFHTIDLLHNNPPALSDMIRGTLYSGVTAGGTSNYPDEEPSVLGSDFEFSISRWAEILSLMSMPNRTYAEVLEAFGVDLDKVQTLPERYFTRRGWLRPTGGVQSWNWGANWLSNPGITVDDDAEAGRFNVNTAGDYIDSHGSWVHQMTGTVATPPDLGLVFAGDRAGITKLGAHYRIKKRRRMIVFEPSILLGTACWWPMMSRDNQYSHHLDMTHMIRPGHWGIPTGGLDESDFIFAQKVADRAGDLLQEDEDQGELSGFRAMNMLNLYLNGDNFCNSTPSFDHFGPGQTFSDNEEFSTVNYKVDASMSAQLAIATDMV